MTSTPTKAPKNARRIHRAAGALLLGTTICATAAWADPLATVERNGTYVAIEPYAPNIVRVTIATDQADSVAAPGPGPNAAPDPSGWARRREGGADVFTSSALALTVEAQPWPKAPTQIQSRS